MRVALLLAINRMYEYILFRRLRREHVFAERPHPRAAVHRAHCAAPEHVVSRRLPEDEPPPLAHTNPQVCARIRYSPSLSTRKVTILLLVPFTRVAIAVKGFWSRRRRSARYTSRAATEWWSSCCSWLRWRARRSASRASTSTTSTSRPLSPVLHVVPQFVTLLINSYTLIDLLICRTHCLLDWFYLIKCDYPD